MTDPLLTIEDATREFRVSPKTIRRRLSSSEIDRAYKRPGSRGPEWVMPRQSLSEAGFVPRPLASPATLPADAGSAPDATSAMPLVIGPLERGTDPDEAIGLVGDRRTDALPRGRVAAPSPRDGWASSTGARFVVATFDDEDLPAPVRALRASSEVLLRTHVGRAVPLPPLA